MYQEIVSIISNREVMPGIYLMWLDAPHLAAEAQPGQFVMVTCDNSQERLLRRPISIYRTNTRSLALLFAVVGAGTEWLAKRRANDKIDILGPLGNGFSINSKSRNLLLIAGGIGIAPLCYLAQETLKKEYQVTLLAGARTACQICPEQLIPEGCKIIPITEDGSAGEKGFVTILLPRYTSWADQIFICGPLPMFKSIAHNYQTNLKGKSVQVSLETRMGCGLGFCYACTIKTQQGLKQVCKHGPVFNLEDVIWEELR